MSTSTFPYTMLAVLQTFAGLNLWFLIDGTGTALNAVALAWALGGTALMLIEIAQGRPRRRR